MTIRKEMAYFRQCSSITTKESINRRKSSADTANFRVKTQTRKLVSSNPAILSFCSFGSKLKPKGVSDNMTESVMKT